MRSRLSHNQKTEAELRDNFAEVEKIAGIGDHPNVISNWLMIRARNRCFLTRTSVRGRRRKKFELFKLEKGVLWQGSEGDYRVRESWAGLGAAGRRSETYYRLFHQGGIKNSVLRLR